MRKGVHRGRCAPFVLSMPATVHGTPPAPDLSAKADIAISQPRFQSPGRGVRAASSPSNHTAISSSGLRPRSGTRASGAG